LISNFYSYFPPLQEIPYFTYYHLKQANYPRFSHIIEQAFTNNNSDRNSIVIEDFYCSNQWSIWTNGPQTRNIDGVTLPLYIIDKSSNKKYLDQPTEVLRHKNLALALTTPFFHTLASGIKIALHSFKILSFYNFWDEKIKFTASCKYTAIDLFHIVFVPFLLAGLTSSAVLGCFSPLNGKKLYASFERLQYGSGILAPCFQPDPTSHLFGGNLDNPNAW